MSRLKLRDALKEDFFEKHDLDFQPVETFDQDAIGHRRR